MHLTQDLGREPGLRGQLTVVLGLCADEGLVLGKIHGPFGNDVLQVDQDTPP